MITRLPKPQVIKLRRVDISKQQVTSPPGHGKAQGNSNEVSEPHESLVHDVSSNGRHLLPVGGQEASVIQTNTDYTIIKYRQKS